MDGDVTPDPRPAVRCPRCGRWTQVFFHWIYRDGVGIAVLAEAAAGLTMHPCPDDDTDVDWWT